MLGHQYQAVKENDDLQETIGFTYSQINGGQLRLWVGVRVDGATKGVERNPSDFKLNSGTRRW